MTGISLKDTQETCQSNPCLPGCAGFGLFMLVIFLSTCWGMVQPTEFGFKRNGISGTVDLSTVHEGGRHFLGWGSDFIVFPRRLKTLGPVVQARTGPGENDNGGGQPVTLEVSFQYRFVAATVAQVYRAFGLNWERSYNRFAAQAITNAAQQFTPRDFWEERARVESTILSAVNATIAGDGFAQVVALQLVAVDFQDAYEWTITNIQLQAQLGVTRRFQLEVTAVEQEIAVLQAQTDAQINTIQAEAARASSVLINNANAEALVREQSAKAEMYARIRSHLNWTQPQFLEYVRMKALNSQPSQSHVKVAMDPVGLTAVGVGTAPIIEPGSGAAFVG